MLQSPHMQTSWNLELLFKNESEITKTRKLVEEKTNAFVKKWSDRTDYLEKPEILKEALNEYEHWAKNYGAATKEGYYYSLQTSLDQNNPKIKASVNKIQEFATRLENEIQFFTIRIAKIDKKLQKEFLSHKLLATYKHFLEKLFAEADHVLSEPEEKILNTVSPLTYGNWVRMLSGFLSKEEREVIADDGKKAIKGFSEIMNLMQSTKKKIRDSAKDAFNDILEKHKDVAENEINAVLQHKYITDTLRKFERPDQARHMSDDIDSDIVDTLCKAVSSRFDISQKYYALKAKLLGVNTLEFHERNVPYGKITKKYSFENASELILTVFKNLDPEFAMIFKEFQENGQIDVYPKKGKQSGAFAASMTLNTPTYILLNHTNELSDVTTLAHELGHGINNELIRAKQNELNFGTPLSTAEVASTFMEDFVFQELEKQANDELRLSLMVMKLNDDISTIFRQIALYNFEIELHKTFREKGYLSNEEIGDLFQKHMNAYMGKAVDQPEYAKHWWIYWSHIRSFFYVYSYASGLLISKSLQASVKKDPKFIRNVKEFLSAGMSDSPKNIFANLGIDITKKSFWDQGLDEIEVLLSETMKLAKRLKKI